MGKELEMGKWVFRQDSCPEDSSESLLCRVLDRATQNSPNNQPGFCEWGWSHRGEGGQGASATINTSPYLQNPSKQNRHHQKRRAHGNLKRKMTVEVRMLRTWRHKGT